METWFSNGRSEIIDAVRAACERVEGGIREEQELARLEIRELQEERDRVSLENSSLKAENVRLKEQLHQAQTKPASTSPTNRDASESDWEAECAKVSSKFNALSENFKKALGALRKRKEERDRWIEHAELLEKKVKAAEEEHGISIFERRSRTARATATPGTKTEAAPSPNTSFVSDAGLDQADLELPPLAAASLSDQASGRASDPAAEKVASPQSESTQGESEARGSDLPELPSSDGPNEVTIKQQPSSDPPVFVSERPVKKRKRDMPQPDETPIRKIKAEPCDESSPLVATGQNALDLQDSIDLGEVVQKMTTPRKRRELEQASRNLFEAATTTPTPLYVRPDLNPQTARPSFRSSALTPLSVNQRNLPSMAHSVGAKPRADKPAPLQRGLSNGISSLAEDGGVYKKDAAGREKNTAKPVPKGRLDALLNNRSISEDEPLTRSNPRPRPRANLPDDLSIPGRRELPFERERRTRDTPTNQQAGTTARSAVPGSRMQPPDTRSPLAHKGGNSLLRSKAPTELGPDDFKINPLANEGLEFAYTEVVRNKDDRGAMSGCTDMHCCGKKWRSMAISQRPDPPLTPAQRQEEQKLLEEYLGELAYRLSSMSKEERDELWVEAKTQELADKYGKHRHRYSRMQSPPGYWNPDFPSTQELEAERAEAARREKQTVQDRYREAMRPGGRWIFRDE